MLRSDAAHQAHSGYRVLGSMPVRMPINTAAAAPADLRPAVIADFARQWPELKIEGTSQPIQCLDFWLVSAEGMNNGERQERYVIARQFYKSDGAYYWRFYVTSPGRYYKELRERNQPIKNNGDEANPFKPIIE